MNISEATAIVQKLQVYQGKIMKPLHARVKDFLIVPASQKEFDLMFKEVAEKHTPLQNALSPFKDNVTVLVCFDNEQKGPSYCYYDYFLFTNDIH